MTIKGRYTKKVHAQRLIGMLETGHCGCPAGEDFLWNNGPRALRMGWRENDPHCKLCSKFVGSELYICPCGHFGEDKASKRSWLALEKGGYLE